MMKTYDAIALDPTRSLPANTFNIFEGFKSEFLQPVPEDHVSGPIEPIIHHLSNVITGEEHVCWLLDWMANMIQSTNKPTTVAVFIQGSQGDGKDIIFDFFRNYVIGTKYSFQTESSESLFGRFSSGRVHKVFVCFDEVDGADLIGNHRQSPLKNAITGDKVEYEVKGVMRTDVPNMCNFLFTSNNPNPIPIPADVFCSIQLKKHLQRQQGILYWSSSALGEK